MENLAAVKDSLNKSENMTQQMLSILDAFGQRLCRLEETIMPIYEKTESLQRKHENIEKTMLALDNAISHYNTAKSVETMIREGPASAGIESYLASMKTLRRAMEYFTEHCHDTEEMSQVTTLYEAGEDALEREFRNTLTRYSKEVQPWQLLDILATEETTAGATSETDAQSTNVVAIEHLPEKVAVDLKQIADWLNTSRHTGDYLQAYPKIRSTILVKSLERLKERIKNGSKDSFSFQSPAAAKTKGSKELLSKKPFGRSDLVRRASQSLKKHIVKLETAGLARPASQNSLKDATADSDIDMFITCVSALLKLIQSENTLMQSILPEKHHRKILESLILPALDVLMKDGESIATSVKLASSRNDQAYVISIFPVLRHLRYIKPEFDAVLENCQPVTRSKIASLISSLDTTGAKALEDFILSLRNYNEKETRMPPDGTVHQLTSNAMIFLEQLQEFSDTAGAMLLSQDPKYLSNIAKEDRPRLRVAEYVNKVLSALGLTLNNKSDSYSDPTLKAIFMLNNYNYMLKTLRRTGLLALVSSWNSEVEKYYEDQILNQKASYSTSWSSVIHYIKVDQDNRLSVMSPDGKMKDKEKQAIKDKFSGFNKEIEEIFRVQKMYAIPDPDLRESIKRDNKTYILPYYQTYFSKYAGSKFSSNPEKYVKYSSDSLSKLLDRFFDATS